MSVKSDYFQKRSEMAAAEAENARLCAYMATTLEINNPPLDLRINHVQLASIMPPAPYKKLMEEIRPLVSQAMEEYLEAQMPKAEKAPEPPPGVLNTLTGNLTSSKSEVDSSYNG